MSSDREILTALLAEVSRLSGPFQLMVSEYAADVMTDAGMHRSFAEHLETNRAMHQEIQALKTSLCAMPARTLSPMMKGLLEMADALPGGSHTNLREIADLVAVELVYKLRDLAHGSGI